MSGHVKDRDRGTQVHRAHVKACRQGNTILQDRMVTPARHVMACGWGKHIKTPDPHTPGPSRSYSLRPCPWFLPLSLSLSRSLLWLSMPMGRPADWLGFRLSPLCPAQDTISCTSETLRCKISYPADPSPNCVRTRQWHSIQLSKKIRTHVMRPTSTSVWQAGLIAPPAETKEPAGSRSC